MKEMTRRNAITGAITGVTALMATSVTSAASNSALVETYPNSTVEWHHTDQHSTVALRAGGGAVAHFAKFANQQGQIIAVCAGIMGKKVTFTTSGEQAGFWTNVHITNVQ